MARIWGVIGAVALCALATTASAQPRPAVPAQDLAAVDMAFAAEAAAHPVGGLTVGVVDHGRLVWTKSYGFADMERKLPADRRTVYRIGSITKQFTGVALLQLAAAGKVKLDDPASKYLPELATVGGFSAQGPSITLLSLATHRAGLAREPNDLKYLQGPISDWQNSVRGALAQTRLQFKPNDEAVYSNIGYGALGLALENAAGVPYTELVEQRIAKPLGMTSTSFRPDADMLRRLAKGYVAIGAGPPTSKVADGELAEGRGYKIPNGGLFTTVDDLGRFLAFEMGYGPPSVLPHEVLAANFARSFPLQGGGRYGIGFTISDFGSKTLIGHGGSVAGFTAGAYFDPQAKIGIVCLRNSQLGCEGTFLQEAFAALVPAWKDQARQARAEDAARAAHVKAQTPLPNSEAVLRRLIEALQSGRPDDSHMSEGFAAFFRERAPSAQARLASLGALQSLAFRGVGPGGADIYLATFSGGKLECRLALGPGDIVQGLSFGPAR